MTDRVLLVVGTVAGGAARNALQLARGLVARGHSVTVACPTGVDHDYGFAASGARVELLEIAERPSPARDARTMRVLRRMAKVADVVHAHGVRAGALACLASKDTPVVVTLHNDRPVHSALSRVAFDTLERVVARQANVVLCVSSDLADRVRAAGGHDVRLAVIPAREWRAPDVETSTVRSEFGHPEQLVVVVGRLVAGKRIDVAVQLSALLHERLPDLLWVVAGDGPLRGELQAQVDSAGAPMRLLGQRADVAQLLVAADAVVSTAQWEGQPAWLQESLAAGCAIVATDVGGTRDVVGDAAVLVPFGDLDVMAQRLAELLTDADLRQAAQDRARDRFAQLPTEEFALDEIELVYRALIDRSVA